MGTRHRNRLRNHSAKRVVTYLSFMKLDEVELNVILSLLNMYGGWFEWSEVMKWIQITCTCFNEQNFFQIKNPIQYTLINWSQTMHNINHEDSNQGDQDDVNTGQQEQCTLIDWWIQTMHCTTSINKKTWIKTMQQDLERSSTGRRTISIKKTIQRCNQGDQDDVTIQDNKNSAHWLIDEFKRCTAQHQSTRRHGSKQCNKI